MSRPTPRPTADDGGTLPAEAKVYTEYAALGDSYSAGRSFLSSDPTCSGAETGDTRNRQDTIVPGPSPAPQLDALTAARTS